MSETTTRRVSDGGYVHDVATVRVTAHAMKAPGRGTPWHVSVGTGAGGYGVEGEGRTVADAAREVAGQLEVLASRADDAPLIVVHESGVMTHVYWQHGYVTRATIRDGRVSCTSSGPWESLRDAADDATRPEAFGAGVVIGR